MRSEFSGDIMAVRAVEDCIRATGKYTEGVFSRQRKHTDAPIQGDDFPSRVLTKYYEVYPDIDLDKSRPFWDAVMTTSDWLWGDTPHVDMTFWYNYATNKARVLLLGGNGVVKLLEDEIPGFREVMGKVVENGKH